MRPIPYRAFLPRVPAVIAGVLLAYLIRWPRVCSWTASAVVAVSKAIGMPIHRVGETQFYLGQEAFYVAIGCTMFDVFLASVPLLWTRGCTLVYHFALIFAAFWGIFALNILRLELGFWLYLHGWSWQLSHEIMAAFFYYAIFEWHCWRLTAPLADATAASIRSAPLEVTPQPIAG